MLCIQYSIKMNFSCFYIYATNYLLLSTQNDTVVARYLFATLEITTIQLKMLVHTKELTG